MSSLFDQITENESTLAANMVLHAHQSIEAWAARHRIKIKMTDADFYKDMVILENALKGKPKLQAVILMEDKT